MAAIHRSTKKLDSTKVRQLKKLACRIDRNEGSAIKAQGRAMFLQHERLRAILRALIAERRRQGLSLSDLAQRTGIAKPNLSRLENSTTATPTLDTLERYARAVGKAVQVDLVDAES